MKRLIALMAFFLVGVPLAAWALARSGVDRGYVAEFIGFCASLLGISRSGVASALSEALLTLAILGGVATAAAYIYEALGEED